MNFSNEKFIFFWLLCVIIIYKCNPYSSSSVSDKKECVISYKKNCIDKKQLKDITEGYNSHDSAIIVDVYVKDWIIKEALYEKAKSSISIDKDELEKEIEDFKKQYYISAYIKQIVKENLDTTVSNKDIHAYYQQHKSSFKLTNNIVQLYYVKLKDDEKTINTFKKLLFNLKDKKQLHQFIMENASSYFIEDSLWLKWDDVTKEIPALRSYDINSLSKGKFMEWKDGSYYYYIKINDYKVKNEYSPLVYEKEKIKKVILDQRKNALIDSLKNTLFIEARQNIK